MFSSYSIYLPIIGRCHPHPPSPFTIITQSQCDCVTMHAGDLGEPVLLHVWIPVPCVHHPHHLLLTDLYRYGLLPTLRRGKLECEPWVRIYSKPPAHFCGEISHG